MPPKILLYRRTLFDYVTVSIELVVGLGLGLGLVVGLVAGLDFRGHSICHEKIRRGIAIRFSES